MPSVLLIDADWENLQRLGRLATEMGFAIRYADGLEKARLELASHGFDLVLAALELPDGSGAELAAALENRPRAALVLLSRTSATPGVRLRGEAVEALSMPGEEAHLQRVLARVAEASRLRLELSQLRDELRRFGRFGRLVGASPRMQRVYQQIQRVAPRLTTVCVIGATGSGKELVARSIHGLSPRAQGPFLSVDCAGIPPTLIASELFGHEREALPAAAAPHLGLFERANGGTLFLDRITELPLELQAGLLRALDTRQIWRVGGREPTAVDVRVVAAMTCHPRQAVHEGRLREDLLHRLLVFPIELPRLRERGDDVELLAAHFLQAQNAATGSHKRLSEAALQSLREHDWPGNVRELENAVERAFIMAVDEIGPECLLLDADAAGEPAEELSVRVGMGVREVEQRLILATLAHCEGNKREAARMLGISLKTLYNRLHDYAARGQLAPEPRARQRKRKPLPAEDSPG